MDTGEWAYGAYVPDALEQTHGDMVTWGFIRWYNREIGKCEMHEADRDTVGQYTGLKDKNGKEIYEGDIIDVEWDTESDEAEAIERVAITDIRNIPKLHGSSIKDCEVIGNIHDNPELLKEASPSKQQDL